MDNTWFFNETLADADPEVALHIAAEEARLRGQIELVAPKNYLSRAAREAMNSMVVFATIEGYPGKRYHAGVENFDAIERLAIERAKAMFGGGHANVQPHSGTQANQAVYFATLNTGDTVLSMDLASGGHLSHGLKSNLSGRWFNTVFYGTTDEGFIDYDAMEQLARVHRPKLIIVGGSSYPRAIDFQRVSTIAAEVGAATLADVAHFSGLIAGQQYPSPFPHIDFLTSTTNKNLRGPRGGLIVCRDAAMGRKIDSAVFPGIQGGPHPNVIAAKAVCFGEALKPEFAEYTGRVLNCARTLASGLSSRGYQIVTGGTDTPFAMVDLRNKGLTGDVAQNALEDHGVTTNRNLVPHDTESPDVTSGLRMGTSAIAARGMGEAEASELAELIADVLDRVGGVTPGSSVKIDPAIAGKVSAMASTFPLYPNNTKLRRI
ncbi:serine hydroxymethyltransferase [Sinorhizobium meliloti]|uniref:serine hydroxymethyltransferase n=1 Tax=Rhizobium meliloti TaxID=382 RepID=UPI00020F3CB2|nr:serine hydroxymethyltransferase [Sinorhizobium meliloti]AEG58036.1 Glycine hydroxymethyltransferase [Sinorhizobium meliloti AK83]MDE4588995.1 serine hydroxymethyltransferase [Sinorhizobium meliloti]